MTTSSDFIRRAIALEHEAESLASIGLNRRAAVLLGNALNLRGMAVPAARIRAERMGAPTVTALNDNHVRVVRGKVA